jgi:hypothetical protein
MQLRAFFVSTVSAYAIGFPSYKDATRFGKPAALAVAHSQRFSLTTFAHL